MTHRRAFLSGALSAALCPQVTWGDAGRPAFLSAARKTDGAYVLCGLRDDGTIAFEVPLPARGHAATAHPYLAHAVAFARRPGVFALVIDCLSGAVLHKLDAPRERHFYGHGCFSPDGTLLFTTENDFEGARGVIGVWDARANFRRFGEFSSGGIGPHDIKMLPSGNTLVVANGGIETHPDSGRTKLNLPMMEPNLAYLSVDGVLRETVTLDRALHKNSIRHLAVDETGGVHFAMQWQGDVAEVVPLLGSHRRGHAPRLAQAEDFAGLQGYLGSIAAGGGQIAVTSPRGGALLTFDGAMLGALNRTSIVDVCGIAPLDEGFFATSGTGHISARGNETHHPRQWDNHLVVI